MVSVHRKHVDDITVCGVEQVSVLEIPSLSRAGLALLATSVAGLALFLLRRN